MFDSQVLDVAIGLVLMFFVLALTSSSIVEAISGILQVRSKKLEQGIEQIVGDPKLIRETSIYSALAGSTQRKPSYMSAKSFADAVVEGISTLKAGVADAGQLEALLPASLRTRLTALTHEAGSDITAIKAGLESWFDDVMDRVSGSYKRWSQIVLFLIGLVLTIGLNASTTHVAGTLWHAPAVRDAVTQAARGQAETSCSCAASTRPTSDRSISSSLDVSAIARDVNNADGLGLPIGWNGWDKNAGPVLTPLGWLITAFLILLGAPFWYGLLTQLVSLRSSGNKPPPAAKDQTSATVAVAASTASGAPALAATAEPPPLSELLEHPAFGPFAG